MTVLALVLGLGFAGWRSETVIDRAAGTVTDHWSICGIGRTRTIALSAVREVVVCRWLDFGGRVRKKVLLKGVLPHGGYAKSVWRAFIHSTGRGRTAKKLPTFAGFPWCTTTACQSFSPLSGKGRPLHQRIEPLSDFLQHRNVRRGAGGAARTGRVAVEPAAQFEKLRSRVFVGRSRSAKRKAAQIL